MHLIDFVSINLLFRGKHKCLGRQLLSPFLFLELSLKALTTLTAGVFPAERRGCVRIWSRLLLSFCVFMLMSDPFVRSFPCDRLKFGHAKILFSVCQQRQTYLQACYSVTSGPRVQGCGRDPSEGSCVWFVACQVLQMMAEVVSSRQPLCGSTAAFEGCSRLAPAAEFWFSDNMRRSCVGFCRRFFFMRWEF